MQQTVDKLPQCFHRNSKMPVNFKTSERICLPDELLHVWWGACFSHLHYKVLITWIFLDHSCSELYQAGLTFCTDLLQSRALQENCAGRSTHEHADTRTWTNFTSSSSLGEIRRLVHRLLQDLLPFLPEIVWGQLALCSLLTCYSQPGGVCSKGEVVQLCLMSE